MCMKKVSFLLFILTCVCVCAFVSCSKNNNQSTRLTQEQVRKIQDLSIEAHRALVLKNNDSIKQFIDKNNLSMNRTGSGLWYSVFSNGSTDTIKSGDIIEIEYRVSLMGGPLLYSSDSTGTLTLKVGQGGVEAGLEESFLLMTPGDSARLFIPPHLGHGLIGDLNRIPWLAILDYHVYIISHKRQ